MMSSRSKYLVEAHFFFLPIMTPSLRVSVFSSKSTNKNSVKSFLLE